MIKSGKVRQRIPLVLSVGILALALLQSIWWMFYLVGEGAHVRDLTLRVLEERAGLMERELQALGHPPDEDELRRLKARYPGFSLMAAEESVTGFSPVVGREAIQAAWSDYNRHARMVLMEGAFFTLVLTSGIWLQIQSHRRMSEAIRQQSNFISGVTHELKSPLTSIRLYAELLENEDVKTEARRRGARVIREETDRLSGLVEQILRARALEARDLKLEPRPLGPDEWLLARLDSLSSRVAAHGRELVLEGLLDQREDAFGDVCVKADPEALDLVLNNLVDNAIKYSGGPVRLGLRRLRHWAEFWVADEGVGFAPEDARRLFDRFWRAGNELTRRTKGTGLGLYLVREFAEAMGGRVLAESEGPGRGARFTVALPLCGKGKQGWPGF